VHVHSRFFTLFLALAVLAAACSGGASSSPEVGSTSTSLPESVDSASPDAPEPDEPAVSITAEPEPLVDLEWLDDPGNEYLLVDARSPVAYEGGHIPDARNVPAAAFNDRSDAVPYQLGGAETASGILAQSGIGPSDTVVLYDNDGSLFAARAYFALTYYSHGDIRILDGGLATWITDDRPVDTGPPAVVAPVEYPVAAVRDDLRLELPDVADALDAGVTTFADARTAAEYDGTLSFDTEFNGHIPGAGNVDHAETIGTDGRFLPIADLQELFTTAGIGPETTVVTYCLVGARAAHAWFVLSELLGYPSVALYDGSWTEYGNTPGVEVET